MAESFRIGAHVFDRTGREFVICEKPDGYKDEPDTVYVIHPSAQGGVLPFYEDDLSLTRPECFEKILEDMSADPSVDPSYVSRLRAYKDRFLESPTFTLF